MKVYLGSLPVVLISLQVRWHWVGPGVLPCAPILVHVVPHTKNNSQMYKEIQNTLCLGGAQVDAHFLLLPKMGRETV